PNQGTSKTVNRGEIYRTLEKLPERGHKPGFYVVVSRDFIADNDDISTIICAPVYREALNLRSEVLVGGNDGFPEDSSIRCDFLTLMMKRNLRILSERFPSVKKKNLIEPSLMRFN